MVSAPELVDAIQRAVSRSPTRVVVVLGSVTFLDSCGCAALVAGWRTGQSHGVLVSLRGTLMPLVRHILHVTTLPTIFDPA
jgi:anti-anti-sigma factor